MKRLSGLLLAAIFVSGCGSNGGSPAGEGTSAEDANRWPGKGDYSTSLTYNGCTDTYKTNNQADYCVALTDEAKSKCNTREMRKSTYEGTCGNDFAPRNILGPNFSGYDRYLGTSCSVGESNKRYKNIPTLCAFLKDESVNQGCFWSDRQQRFREYDCSGSFSPQPVAPPAPSPAPQPGNQTPNPNPPNQPAPQPKSSYDKLVEAYAQVGIKIDQNNQHDFPEPGEAPYYQRIQVTIPVLQKMVSAFANRVETIDSITIGTYTSYRYNSKHLTLEAGFDEAATTQYLGLHDQRISLIEETGVHFSAGIESHSTKDNFAPMRTMLQRFIALRSDLKAIHPFVTEFRTSNYTHLSPVMHEYQVNETTFDRDVKRDLPLIKRLAAIAKLGVELKQSDIEIEKPRDNVNALLDYLIKNSAQLQVLRQALGKLDIDISMKYDAQPTFYSSLKQLSVGVDRSLAQTTGIDALFTLGSIAGKAGAKIDISNHDLDQSFVAGVKLLSSCRSRVEALKGKLKQISITSMSSDYSYGTLYVGTKDSDAVLDKALAKAEAQ